MNEAEKIAKLLGHVKSIKQSDLCEACGINKGQLSAYLKSRGSLAEEKQVALIAYILKRTDELREQGVIQSAETSELIKQLKDYPLYQALHGDAEPGSIIMLGHENHVERPHNLLKDMQTRPFVVGITGGPKTGKSTWGRELQYRLRKEQVIFVDCKEFAQSYSASSQFIGWLIKSAASQWPKEFNEYPKDWPGVVQWLKLDILRNAPCTFIFDHLEALGEAYQQFSSGWHHVLNQSRREPILDNIGLVLIFDEANTKLYQARTSASRIEQRMRISVAQPFPKGAFNSALDAIVGTMNDENKRTLRAQLWELFHGHPYLTHCYVHAYGNHPPDKSQQAALLAAEMAFKENIIPHLRNGVYIKTLDEVFQTPNKNLIKFQAKEESHAMFLLDTQLFIEADNMHLCCATPWIQERLIEFLPQRE